MAGITRGDEFDAIVVGGGMAGASVAYELAVDRRVVLLEAESAPGYHSTGRSAAMFLESYGGPDVRALTKASRVFFEAPPAGFAGPLMTPRAFLHVGRPGQGARVRALFDEISCPGDGLEMLDASRLQRVCPLLRDGAVVAGLYEPNAQALDVHALHQGYLRELRRRGGGIRCGAKVVAVRPGVRGWQVEAGDAPLTAPLIVNAAGAWADLVAAAAGVAPVGLVPLRRTAFTIAAEESLPAQLPMLADLDEAFYIKPEGEVLLCSPSDRTPCPPGDAKPDQLEIARALDHIRAVTNLRARSVRASWAGLRTFSPDGNLVIGDDRDAPGFFWFAGQGGYGIQTAPAAARVAAALIRGERPPADVTAFGFDAKRVSPHRFSAG